MTILFLAINQIPPPPHMTIILIAISANGHQFTHLIPRYVVNGDGTDESGDCSDSVRQAHQDTGVPRRNVQVVDVVPGDGEPTAGHANRQRCNSSVLKDNKRVK